MDNQIIEDLEWRHATKKYDPQRKISQEHLDIIFESIRLCPSSINSQPWKFIVLESDEAKERMNQTFAEKYHFNQPHVFDSSHIILFCNNPRYTRDDYARVVDTGIRDGRTKPEDREGAFGSFYFAELNTDENGCNGNWTRHQLYIAMGNLLHVLARLRIDSTPLEGIDTELVNREFQRELDGYECHVALAMGYHHDQEDYNAKLPKSRHRLDEIMIRI